MNDLERWGQRPTSIIASREERGHTKKMDAIVFEAQETALQIDADAAVTSRIMDRAASLNAHRIALAQGNPTLDAVLMRIEIGFAIKAEQRQREYGRRFGL